MFKLEFDTDNAAFSGNSGGEIARILQGIADKMERNPCGCSVDGLPIRDINGHRVGTFTYVPSADTDDDM